MKGNPHYRNLEEGYSTDNPDHAATVHAEALLAFAYEQRTANLIAAHQASNLIVNDADRLEIEREILHRLGVRDDA